MNKKIVFNCLPPFFKFIPSAGLSILKTFLKHNNFESDIIYWNTILDCKLDKEILIAKKREMHTENLIALFPYLYLLAEEYNDQEVMNRIFSYLGGINPANLINENLLNPGDYYQKYLIEIKKFTLDKINEGLAGIDFSKVLCWAISAKFFQWISGYILAKEIKKRDPEAKIITGGFGNKDEAHEIMKSCRLFDYAIYGEGEYPLLDLCNYLKNKTSVDLKNIPRLIYRENQELKISETAKSKYLDFNEFIMPDYSDYDKYREIFFKEISKENNKEYKKNDLAYPINTIRSCRWKRCKFCNYSSGYNYREKSPEVIVREIEFLYDKHHAEFVSFMDNDTIGKDIKRFEYLLDILIESNLRHKMKYDFWMEIIFHKELNSRIYRKMRLAGIKRLFGGFEATSDRIMQKMDKINGFAENILFMKFCVKYNFDTSINILCGSPGETIEDVKESIINLHYLRFFYHGDYFHFPYLSSHILIYKDAKFNKMLSNTERKKYNPEKINDFIPAGFIEEPFNVFAYIRYESLNNNEWGVFKQVVDYYLKHKFTYEILRNKNIYYYFEYLDKELFSALTLNEFDYEVLSAASNEVISLEDMHKSLLKTHDSITEEEIKEILSGLKKQYLIYHNIDYSGIVSIIDTDIIN